MVRDGEVGGGGMDDFCVKDWEWGGRMLLRGGSSVGAAFGF